MAAPGAAQERPQEGQGFQEQASGTPGSQSPTPALHVPGVGLVFPLWLQNQCVHSVINLHCFCHPLFSPRPFCLEGSYAGGTKAFSQTNTVIEGNQKDSSRSRGGQDDILNFQQFLKRVYIPLFLPLLYPVRGREKSKAFRGRRSEGPHSYHSRVGAAGAKGVLVADCN